MKKILIIIAVILAILLGVLAFFFKSDAKDPYFKTTWGKFSTECAKGDVPDETHGKDMKGCDYSVDKKDIPTFTQVPLNFKNEFDNKKSLPLMASATIDIDNDGVDELFLSGGLTQEDKLFRYTVDGFIDISGEVNLPKKSSGTTFGAVSFDLDNNGDTDLLLTGDYGVVWLKNTNGKLERSIIEVPLNNKSVAASLTLGDVNADGHADMFVSAYIKIDQMEGQTIFKKENYGGSSLLMINNGDNTFSDKTEEYGLTYTHNTFMAILVDIDNDSFLDLIVAHDTGDVRSYQNQEGKKFVMKKNPTTGKYGYPMGIAVGDYNNDGFVDFFFSNTGSSVPAILARGDLDKEDELITDWILFRNDGDFKFTDAAEEAKVADFEFSWGAIFEDFNLDGLQDLVVAENYVDFPPHKLFKLPCRFLIQRPDGTFAAVEEQAKVINKNYAITPITSDFNNDGYPDLVYTNIAGVSNAYINDGGDANFISYRFKENSKNAGARLIITKEDNSIMMDTYIIGEGLASDQSNTLTFGLGSDTTIKSAKVIYSDGTEQVINNIKINTKHQL